MDLIGDWGKCGGWGTENVLDSLVGCGRQSGIDTRGMKAVGEWMGRLFTGG